MPESSSRSFPTVPTALSALTAQSMTPAAQLPHPPSLGAGALLRWLLRRAAVPVTLATLAACTSNIIQAIVPAFLGQALDAGIENGLNGRVWGIGALLLVLFVVYAVGDTMLSYFGVTAWMRTAFDVDRLVGRQISATGKDLSRQVSTGEVATIIASDADYLGKFFEHLPALLGAAASFVVVAVLMLRTSVSLGLIVILGMPLVAAIVTLVIRPLQKRQAVQREAQSTVTTITTDTVAGLRILRGIGGEDVFARRYRDASQELRRRGVEVASSQATLMTLQVLLPGLFAAIVVWVAARMAVAGSLTPGGLITFYGYTAYLSWPLWVFTSSVQDYTRAVVGARRLSRLLEVAPAAGSLVERLNLDPAAAHPVSGDLVDTGSGLRLEEGRMTALVCPDPQVSAELATRLGRFTDPGPTVTLAVGQLTALAKAGRLDLELFARSCEGALMGSKANALRVLGVLRDGLGTVEDTEVEPLLGVAFSFPDAQVQRAALGLARDYVTASLLTRESVAAIVSQADLDPLVTPEAREFVSAGTVGDRPGPGHGLVDGGERGAAVSSVLKLDDDTDDARRILVVHRRVRLGRRGLAVLRGQRGVDVTHGQGRGLGVLGGLGRRGRRRRCKGRGSRDRQRTGADEREERRRFLRCHVRNSNVSTSGRPWA